MTRAQTVQLLMSPPANNERRLLALLTKRPLTPDAAASILNIEEPEAATLVSELVGNGKVLLVVVAHAWGVDYELHLSDKGRASL